MAPFTTGYSLHGVGLTFSGESAVARLLGSRLKALPLNGHHPDALRFEFSRHDEGAQETAPPPDARPVYDPPEGHVLYSDGQDRLYMEYPAQIALVSDPAAGHTTVWLRPQNGYATWLASHGMFNLPLVEKLKRRGLYSLHAAGLAIADRALLLAGPSGSGKSTLTIAMVRAGFDFMGDDTLFISRRNGGLRAHAFPDEVDFTDATAGFFPELQSVTRNPARDGWAKRQMHAEDVYAAEVRWEATPAIVVLPRITGEEKSILKPLDKGEALISLAPNVLLTEPESSQAHLDILGELVDRCDCYRLETGRDLDRVPELLRSLVEGA